MANNINLATFDFETSKLEASIERLQKKQFDLKATNTDLAKSYAETQKKIKELAESQQYLSGIGSKSSDEFKKNNEALKALKDTQEKTFIAQKNLAVQTQAVNAEYRATVKTFQSVVGAEGEVLSLTQLSTQALEKQINTKAQASASTSELTKITRLLNPSIKEEAELLTLLNAKIDTNTAFIKTNSSETEKQRFNIGNYTESIEKAIAGNTLLGGALKAIGVDANAVGIGFKRASETVEGVVNAFKDFSNATETAKESQKALVTAQAVLAKATEDVSVAQETATAVGFRYNQGKATQTELEVANTAVTAANTTATEAQAVATVATTAATNASSVALRLFRIALISTGVGAIVVILGSLIAYLASTQEGIDKVTTITRPLQAIFSSLLGVLQKLGKSLFETFSNPKKALNDLVDLIKNNLMNRLKAFGVILEGILTRDFSKIKDGFLQGATGVENLTGKLKLAGKEAKAFFDEAIKKGQELDRLEKELTKVRLNNKLAIGELSEELKRQNSIAENTAKPIKEREAAAFRSIQVAKDINALKQKELDLEIAILKNKQSRNDISDAEKQELNELIAKKNEANAAELEIVTTQQTKLNSIRKDAQTKAAEIVKKSLADAISLSKAELDLFLSSQGIKVKSLQEQISVAEKVRDSSLKIAQQEFNASEKTQADKLNLLAKQNDINKEFLETQRDAVIANAEFELQEFLSLNQSKLDSQKFFSDESYILEIERLTRIAEAQKEFQKQQFDAGLISLAEYNLNVRAIDDQFITENKDRDLQRNEAQKAKDAIDLENKRLASQENLEYDLGFQLEELERKRELEVEQAEKTGANITDINDKYAKMQKDIEASVLENKIALASDTFGALANIAGKESAAGKSLAIAQTTIDTYQGAIAAYKALAGIPVVGPALGGVAAAGAIKTGFDTVKKISATPKPKGYATGGIITDGMQISRSNGDNVMITARTGEAILNESQQRFIGSDMLAMAGVPGFNSSSRSVVQNSVNNGAEMSAMIAEAVRVGASEGTYNGSKKGSTDGLVGLSDNRNVRNLSEF